MEISVETSEIISMKPRSADIPTRIRIVRRLAQVCASARDLLFQCIPIGSARSAVCARASFAHFDGPADFFFFPIPRDFRTVRAGRNFRRKLDKSRFSTRGKNISAVARMPLPINRDGWMRARRD